jgi:hypothetical protein
VNDTPFGAYEAEQALLSGPVIASSQTGYTGPGFADYINASGDYVDWTVSTPEAGLYDLNFRYALQSGTRPLSVQLNGQTIEPSLAFSATGNWQNWGYSTIESLYLPAGTNSIRATAIGFSGANIDHLLVETGLAADLNRDGDMDAADWAIFKAGQGRSFAGTTAAQSYFSATSTATSFTTCATSSRSARLTKSPTAPVLSRTCSRCRSLPRCF